MGTNIQQCVPNAFSALPPTPEGLDATRRGWVQPIFLPPAVYPAACRYCVICVVFPEPVSATTITTWWCSMASNRVSRWQATALGWGEVGLLV